MTTELERDLGLWSVMAISVGAMVGSGIFILPALAMEMAGPAVVVAYALAGLLVLPAALSKSEMATAMPEAGGTYIYIERSMGPLFGTIAGIGTWFALSFKGTLALVGGAPYIVLLVAVRPDLVAVGAAIVLIAVNLVGVKQTGRMQIGIVAVMLAAMTWFVVGAGGAVSSARFGGFLESGTSGILAATGFVFVSYAGVTKIASVAEEIEDPGRTIPLGMLGSLGFTTVLYVLVVVVLVGASGDGIAGSNTPVADVAVGTLSPLAVGGVVLAAVLALVSTANAGLLSSSRYPFAMSRDELAPAFFEHVSPRFNTPTIAIALTGAVMLAMILAVPLSDIAKLGSAFQILVFLLINVAVVMFRESDIEEYDPVFTDPLYPWSQAFGIAGGVLLLTQMGIVPAVGTVLIVAVGLLWYLAYVRPRVDREGVARDEIRRRIGRRAIGRTEAVFDGDTADDEVLVAIRDNDGAVRRDALLGLGAAIAEARGAGLTAVLFETVPDQLPLEPTTATSRRYSRGFEEQVSDLDERFDVAVEHGEVVSHDTGRAIVNLARHDGADLLVAGGEPGGFGDRLLGHDIDHVSRHAPCDLVLFDAGWLDVGDEIALVTDRGPFDPLKVQVADAIASATDAEVELVHAAGPSEETDVETIDDYHADLAELLSVPVSSTRLSDGDPDAVAAAVGDAGLVIVGSDDSTVVRTLDDRSTDDIAEEVESGTLVIRPDGERQPHPVSRLAERLAF